MAMPLSQLQRELLELGLEDLIPLPEAFFDSGTAASPLTGTFDDFRMALVGLLHVGLIQVWSGHWNEEPRLVSVDEAHRILGAEQQYTLNSPADLKSRAYFANVDNIRGESVAEEVEP